MEVCRSQHTQSWLGALYAYKGLLLIVGVYMAWETRHVKIPALNDSQYIGVSVYLVVITSAIVVVLANLISERVTLAFITISALILTSTTATLCLLFLPKLHDIWHKLPDPVIHTMGLKMECNTRRFVTDDRRELQYRVEVQNRVYKKEVAALDAEIQKLERLLEQPPLSSTSSAVDLGRHIKVSRGNPILLLLLLLLPVLQQQHLSTPPLRKLCDSNRLRYPIRTFSRFSDGTLVCQRAPPSSQSVHSGQQQPQRLLLQPQQQQRTDTEHWRWPSAPPTLRLTPGNSTCQLAFR